MKYWIVVVLILVSGLMTPRVTRATEPMDPIQQIDQTELIKPINLLITLPFNPILPWSQEFIKGISNAVASDQRKVNVFVESMFLDSNSSASITNFVEALETKYQDTRIDALVAASVQAEILFEILYESEKFRTVDKYSINHSSEVSSMDNRLVKLDPFMTKVLTTQTNYIFATFPNTKHVFINRSAKNLQSPREEAFRKLQQAGIYDFTIHILDFVSVADARSQISRLPDDSIFIYLPQFTHELNKNITPKGFLQAIVPYSNAPIFSYWITFIGDGVVGGYLLDPLVQGTSIIQIVLGKLSTDNINQTLPFASWMIDQQQADKYNIAIPENIQPQYIFNRDTNILSDYPLESGGLLAVLAMLGIGLFWVRQIKLGGAIRVAEQSKRQALRSAIKATRSSEAKSKFLANISHEIRTPINGMFGVLNILSKTTLNKEQINLLQMGRFCTETLLRTVSDVLDFSKLESRQLQLKEIGFSPVQLLKESYAYGLLISDEQPITIELQIDKLIDVPLLGDQTRLRQIIDNLISNAVKFTDHGNIIIGATITPEDNCYKLTCWVKDPGEGISEADLKRLFQPFVQIEDSYTKTRSGTGLGLALCKELIALMQGDIHMESTEGVGTEVLFSVTLPLAEVIASEEPETLQIDLPLLQHANILFVEDNPINQEITIVQLQHYGITMTVMNNGKECVDHLLTNDLQYDVILMDIQMPIMNGYEASQAIRRGEAGTNNANIPIIALTAHVSLEEQQKALQAGMNKHINKPIVPELLLKAIYDCIQTHDDVKHGGDTI